MAKTSRNRSSIIRHEAERYLLTALLSFALSVSLTRLYLELTGYPQIGGGELHIAHVLWGGLFLFAACLLMLIVANRWVFTLGAVLGGIGVGLFIDEVGKFITKDTNYFYPAAAPIIYAFFLLTVFVYLRVRRIRQVDPRAELYTILQDMTELLDHDLSEEERDEILYRLDRVIIASKDQQLTNLAADLKNFFKSSSLSIVPEVSPPWRRLLKRWENFEHKYFGQLRMKLLIIVYLAALGVWMIGTPVALIVGSGTPHLFQEQITNRVAQNASGMTWIEARVGLEGTVGVVLILSAVLFIINRDRLGITLGSFILLVSLTIVNLVVFYFDQFFAIITSIIQFILLGTLLRYRWRFLRGKPPSNPDENATLPG